MAGTRVIYLKSGKPVEVLKPGAYDYFRILQLVENTVDTWWPVITTGVQAISDIEAAKLFVHTLSENLSEVFKILQSVTGLTEEDFQAQGDKAIEVPDLVEMVKALWEVSQLGEALVAIRATKKAA